MGDSPKITGNFVRLHSGVYLDYTNPKATPFLPEDIAVGLSNICRFASQLYTPYSVAEHSVNCLNVARTLGLSLEEKRAVLMHDAAECVMGDMPKPLKVLLPEYSRIEDNVAAAIRKQYGIDEHKEVVKEIDLMMLKAEKKFFFGRQDQWHCLEKVPDFEIDIYCNPPGVSRVTFLTAMDNLGLT